MKYENLGILNDRCIYPRGKGDIAIAVVITKSRGYEGFVVFIFNDILFVSLTDNNIEDNPPLKEGYLDIINEAVSKSGGIEYIIDNIQSLYNEDFKTEEDYLEFFGQELHNLYWGNN